MSYLKISLSIFVVLATTRFVPHPPNFTSLIALSFYVPVIFGSRFIPATILSFAITDLFIGMHGTTFFTWGSVLFISILSNYFSNDILKRLSGALLGALIFFAVTNFGVWSNGIYGYSLKGLITCYTLAIPFFAYSLISTLLFSTIIEMLIKLKLFRFNKKLI